MITRRSAISTLSCLTVLGATGAVIAQDSYPTKPIKIIIPTPAGGGADQTARLVADHLSAAWGQAVVVESKPGASGAVAASTVAQSPADGYTLLLSISSITQLPALQARLPYKITDFAPVTTLAWIPVNFAVNSTSPIRTLADLIAQAKAQPGRLSYGSYGNATSAHIFGEMMKRSAGIDMIHVPYKGEAPVVTDLLGGAVTSGWGGAQMVQQHKGGKLRIIAVANARRVEYLPDTPTFIEAGIPQISTGGWYGVFAPAATPRPIVEKISAELGRFVKRPDIITKFADMGIDPVAMSPSQFSQMVTGEVQRWARTIGELQIKSD